MAGEEIYGGPEMTVSLQYEGISPEANETLFASTSPSYFNGSRSMLRFEGQHRSPAEHSLFRQVGVDETGNDDFDDCCFHQPEKKRRLTSNQVKFLEKSFEVENKLEPERKIQIARDVGLQPRQVAVWFQNRRARWKTKQLEKDYAALKTSYDHLKDDHENLVNEKQKLWQEVQVLRGKLVQKGAEAPRAPNVDARPNQRLQGPDLDFSMEEKKAHELLILGCKHEDVCSAISIVFHPESPRCTAEGDHYLAADSTNILWGLDNSNVEVEKVHGCFPELDEPNPCSLEFPEGVEHSLWPWLC